MSADTRYCYHCRVHHPSNETRQITTKTGTRWRCLRSIQATQISEAERTAFGRSVSAMNTAEAQSRALRASEHNLDLWNRR